MSLTGKMTVECLGRFGTNEYALSNEGSYVVLANEKYEKAKVPARFRSIVGGLTEERTRLTEDRYELQVTKFDGTAKMTASVTDTKSGVTLASGEWTDKGGASYELTGDGMLFRLSLVRSEGEFGFDFMASKNASPMMFATLVAR